VATTHRLDVLRVAATWATGSKTRPWLAHFEHSSRPRERLDRHHLRGQLRPVVIVQDDRFDATASVTVCPMTCHAVDAPLTRIDIEPTAGTGIPERSQIMVDKVTTLPRANVREHLGRLPNTTTSSASIGHLSSCSV
jgi:mRNA-degrading endonuclease toxin of MazEF toxin-antitoxin module